MPKAIQKLAFLLVSLSVLAKVQHPVLLQRSGCVCVGRGSPSNPSFHSRAAVPRAAAGVFGEDGRGGQKGVGERARPRESSPSAHREGGSDMKH